MLFLHQNISCGYLQELPLCGSFCKYLYSIFGTKMTKTILYLLTLSGAIEKAAYFTSRSGEIPLFYIQIWIDLHIVHPDIEVPIFYIQIRRDPHILHPDMERSPYCISRYSDIPIFYIQIWRDPHILHLSYGEIPIYSWGMERSPYFTFELWRYPHILHLSYGDIPIFYIWAMEISPYFKCCSCTEHLI